MSNKNREYLKVLDTLTDALGRSEGESAEEIKEELRNDGIDVDGILTRLKDAQKNISMEAKRSALDRAREKRLNSNQRSFNIIGQFSNWTKEQLIKRIISEIGAAEARFAYRDLENMSPENLASILEDLETINTNNPQEDESHQ
ncbi:MAG: hypothetical protein D3920_10575 [Candidatus Electrothrix sp. AW2]|nr:hypothetical protein [Candidatus Electrothrix sp. AX1]MCI5135494.1 hypothetical protein [Candidatus Electrothrix gigas]MCI5180702.1 hypothetical protein [Candidatus Electrothrix gigas]MCI5183432.1 hypothetical protein [Candidatus Electrothrix gigas]MCI5227723.1 hypothetical protein [Candidatus Electrothrix gigas]